MFQSPFLKGQKIPGCSSRSRKFLLRAAKRARRSGCASLEMSKLLSIADLVITGLRNITMNGSTLTKHEHLSADGLCSNITAHFVL